MSANSARAAHIDNTDRLDARFRRLDAEQSRGLTALHAPPELALGREDEVLIERIGIGADLDPFPATRDHRQYRRPEAMTHMLCCSWAVYLSAAASSENDQGSINFDSKTAPLTSTRPSSGAQRRCTSLKLG
jgi:hypothetical protein